MNFKQCVRESATLFRRSHIRFAKVSLTRRSRLFAVEKSRPGNFKHQKVTYTAVFIVGRGPPMVLGDNIRGEGKLLNAILQ